MRSGLTSVVLSLLLVPVLLHSQPPRGDRTRMNRVVVSHLPGDDGNVRTSGWVVAIDDSVLSLDIGDRFVSIDREEITTVELRLPPNREFGAVGLAAGAWLLNYIVIRHYNRDDGRTPDVESTWVDDRGGPLYHAFIGTIGAIPGGLLGMIADNLLIEVVRTFRSDRDDEWSALRKQIERVHRPWEIGLHSGWRVWNGGEKKLDDRHGTAGVLLDDIPPDHTSLQWLRRGSFHLALSNDLSVGAEWIDLTHPIRGHVVELPGDSSGSRERDRRHEVFSLLDADGYALTVLTRPFGPLPNGLDFRTGVGGGVAVGAFEEAIVPFSWSNPEGVRSTLTEPAVIPFGMLTAELTGHLTEGLTIGVSGDLVLLLSRELPEFEISGSRSNVGFGSATIGFVVGYRF